jgi:3-dehydroquinate synthase
MTPLSAPAELTLDVRHPHGSYPVRLGSGLLDNLGSILRALPLAPPPGQQLLVVSDSNVGPLYGQRALFALQRAGFAAQLCTVAAGESSKSLHGVEELVATAAAARIDRGGAIIALGGGVVGDLAGLLAALYLRGVALVQVPTSLLALVDSSIGGKVGVNSRAGKNLIGAFVQPLLVVGDLDCLRTLPAVELRSGLGEVVKSALLSGPAAWATLRHFAAGSALPPSSSSLLPLIGDALGLKQRLVESDPYEQGQRALLNLGHTFGHGIEAADGFRQRHGEAVGLGLVAALRLGVTVGRTDPQLLGELLALLAQLGLPVHLPGLDVDAAWRFMQSDKKRHQAGLRIVLVDAPGVAALVDGIPEALALAALASLTVPAAA